MHPRNIIHCNLCGAAVEYRVPPGDTHARAVCASCGHIQYENPRNIVGTVPVWQDRVLLCRRAIEPRLGLWTLPAGFMELGETSAEGALRETREEAGVEIELGGLYCVANVRPANQVYLLYRASIVQPSWDPGPETLEARLFGADDLPWDELAFRTVREALRRHFDEQRDGSRSVHVFDID